MRHLPLLLLLPAVLLVRPQAAHACGGTFCDTGPTTMPVDQTGENILFIKDGPAVEAHIQIQYQGEAARFAWVIPLPGVPEFSVGSQLLFDELLRASVPQYGLTRTSDMCGDPASPFGAPRASSEAGGTGSSSSGGGQANNGPTVVLRETVGSFDVTVLEGGTAAQVLTWLADNNYAQLPGALAIIEQYKQENNLFAAVKLTGGAGVEEIHPLVLRYNFGFPCVPLRLTAVAATSNMGVRTFFLGSGRTVPRTYRHVEVNPYRIDWLNSGSNYREVVINAADDPASGGHGFVTEYAGFSDVIRTGAFRGFAWTDTTLGADPVDVIRELENQGILSCNLAVAVDGAATCGTSHPLLRGLLRDFLPAPAGLDEYTFWNNLGMYTDRIDQARWDADTFRAAYRSRILAPADHARDLVQQHPYLTRMLTFLSPDEMTVDPEFHERADLPQVQQVRTATVRTRCDGSQVLVMPDGRELELDSAGAAPVFGADMPWAEKVQDIPESGSITTLADNSSSINAKALEWNRTTAPDHHPAACGCHSSSNTELPWMALGLVALGALRRRRG